MTLRSLSKRADTQLTLGLALGFGGTALLLTAILFFLFGYYFGRRRALSILGDRRGNYSAVGLGALGADSSGTDNLPRRPNKLRSSSSNDRARTASSYSYTGITGTDGDSVFSRSNNIPVNSMQVEMPPNSALPSQSAPPQTAPDQSYDNDLYGSWYGGRNPAIGNIMNSPSVYVEQPPEQRYLGSTTNTSRPSHPGTLRPGARMFGHGTPLTQISESSTTPSFIPLPPQEAGNGHAASSSPAPSDMQVEMPTLTPSHTYGDNPDPPPGSTFTSLAPKSSISTRINTPAASLGANTNVNRTNTTSKPPSYPFHELSGQTQGSKNGEPSDNNHASASSGTRGESSSLAVPNRRYSRVLGPRAASTQIPVKSKYTSSPMYVEMPSTVSPSTMG